MRIDSERTPAFIASYVSLKDRTGDTLEDLDLAFAAWLKSDKRQRFAVKDVIRIVGCALGERSIERLGVHWARVTDAHGSDIALVADDLPARSYPFNSVQYRIEDNKVDFIVALFRTLEHMMKQPRK